MNVPPQQLERAREFWKMGMSADYTTGQPNTPGRQTTQVLFAKWDDEARKEFDIETNERQIMEKVRLKASFERLVGKLEFELNRLENIVNISWSKWQEENRDELSKPNPDYSKIKEYKYNLQYSWLNVTLIKSIGELRDAMAANMITPTMYEESETNVIEHLKDRTQKLLEKSRAIQQKLDSSRKKPKTKTKA